MTDSTTSGKQKSGKKSTKKHDQPRNHYTTVKMAPCKVCGGKSTGYHFGVVSCEACKAFFRRAIAKESYGKYVCQRGNNCGNFLHRINSCCACRLKRCFEAGMSKDGVRRGRYSIELRTKSILDAQKVENDKLKMDGESLNKSSQSFPTSENIFTATCTPIQTAIQTGVDDLSNSISQPMTFPFVQTSSDLKSSLETPESRDNAVDLTNQNDCVMKTFCEGYSFCQKDDCVSEQCDDLLDYVHPSPDSGTGSSCSSDVLHSIHLTTEPYLDFDSLELDTEVESDQPVNLVLSRNEDQQMDKLIETLVKLQGALYPHHKVTEDILQKQKIIERQHQQREEAFLFMFGTTEYASSDDFKKVVRCRYELVLTSLIDKAWKTSRQKKKMLRQHQQREEAFLFMFGTTEYASSHDFKEVLSEVNIELDDRLTRFREKARATETSIVRYIYHSKFIPGFKQLNKDDVSNLLKASYSEFWLFSNFATINEGTGVAGGTDVVLNGHKKVIKTFFPKDYVDDVFAFAQSLQKLDLNLIEVSLIRVIILTLVDRCTLKEPNKVESLNQLFIRCLQYHLKKSTQDPNGRFYKIFDRLIAVRTLMHKNKKTNENFLKEWGFLMTEFPLWREMMVSQLPHLTISQTGSVLDADERRIL